MPTTTPDATRLALLLADLEGGGAQRKMVTLARAFAERGLAVDLLAASPHGTLREQLGPSLRLCPLDGWWSRLPLVASKKRRRVMACAPALATYLRRARPHALMSTSHSVNVTAVLGWTLARVPTRLVLRIDSQVSRAQALAGTRTQRRRLRRARRFFPKADAIIAISRGVAEDLAQQVRYPQDRIHAIHNPVVTPELEQRMRRAPTHPWLTDGGAPVVLGVGRLVEQKDFPTLLRAFARLRRERAARLLVLGEGKERDRLEALAGELGIAAHVALPGFDPNPLAAMAHAALFVMSSAWEGFGSVLVEALACGCPVLSTRCPSGPAEILDDGRYGTLVPVGDDRAMAAAMATALEQPPDPEPLRQRARHFSLPRITERYLEVLLDGAGD